MNDTQITQITQPLSTAVLYKLGKFDSANRWWPHAEVAEYFAHIRAPSRAWPLSYWRAAKTIKFARWYVTQQHGAQI